MTGMNPFDEHLARWRTWTTEPWGRLRFAVVRHTLAREVAAVAAAVGSRPLRVLDVGGGDGRDSEPLAAAGHQVTVMDTAPGMLAEARRRAAEAGLTQRTRTVHAGLDDLPGAVEGGYDLVLCHFLLHYRPTPAEDVALLAELLGPEGRLSVIAPNPDGLVLQKLVRRGPVAALEELASDAWHTVTFDEDGHKLSHEACAVAMSASGLDVVSLYGGRCANDLLTDDDAKYDAEYYADLERLELQLCDREPFRRIGTFWQLVAQRCADPPGVSRR
jgi:S-adenosylmethionine-dependent methyltransferase